MIDLGKTHLTFENSRLATVRQIVFPGKPIARVRPDLIPWALRLRPRQVADPGDGLRPQRPRVGAALATLLAWQQLSRLATS